MKKKVLLLIILLLVVVGCGKKNKSKESEELDNSLLVVAADYHFKYAATNGGTAIYGDGTVYTWYFSISKKEYNSYMGSYSIGSKTGFDQFIKDKAKKSTKVVSKEDLIKIKNNIDKLGNPDTNCKDDIIYSDITIYKDNLPIRYSTSGKCDLTGSNESLKELLELINKYKK